MVPWTPANSSAFETMESCETSQVFEELVVANGKANIAVRRSGAGTPVVLLHPGVADQRCWDDVATRLAESLCVITYDRRGFGATRHEHEAHTSVHDLVTVLDALRVDRAHLVGNSMGGGLAIELGLLEPDRVASLVLIATAVGGAPPPDEVPDEIDRLASEIDRLESAGDLDGVNELEARLWLDGPFRPPGFVTGSRRELFFDMNGHALRSEPTGEIDSGVGASAWDRLEEMDLPTLALVGDHDMPHIKERTKAVTSRINGAQFSALPRSAHLPQMDDPRLLSDLTGEFLERR
jgi:pimeloyl-ACP methyl ester carboxylesterase